GLVRGVVRLVGTSEMTHQERKLEGGQQLLCGRDGVDVGCGQAKPVHAAVDVDGGGQSDGRRLCQCGPLLDLAGAVEHGTQGKPEIEGTSVFEQPAKDVNVRVGKQSAKLFRLAPRRGD